jgi:3-oxoacyl-[acyl-carrier protein] reductase
MSNADAGGERFAGRVAIVTGGASGIGRATAQRLAREGAAVVVADMQEAVATEVAEALAAHGARASAVPCNVTSEEQVSAMVEHAMKLYGRVDILANVAGVTAKKASVDTLTLEEFNRVIAINLAGTFLCAKHASAVMKKQRYGRIVNVASTTAVYPTSFGNTPYTASKGGVAAITRQWVLELSSFGITVNAVAPGPTRTPLTENIGEAMLQNRLRSIPVGRLGTGEDMAAAIAFFASEDASYVTGQMLVVDGGLTVVMNPHP